MRITVLFFIAFYNLYDAFFLARSRHIFGIRMSVMQEIDHMIVILWDQPVHGYGSLEATCTC